MGKLIEITWLLLAAVEFFITVITFYYLNREYIKATKKFNETMDEQNTKKRHIKKKPKKNIIKSNSTEYIRDNEINENVGYAFLEFSKDGNYITREKMIRDKIKIGRDYRNDIIIKDLTVSRRQCLIMKRDNRFILKNFSESNITRLNDKIVNNKAEIKYGDTVRIGRLTFKFVDILDVV